MKKVVILTIGLLMAVASANASVKPENVAVESKSSVPVAIKVVTPEVAPEFAGSKFNLTFVVDEKGKVIDITSLTKISPKLVLEVSKAVSRWEFVPAYRNGLPIATKVVLPVVVIAS
jgi:hypothetical protein